MMLAPISATLAGLVLAAATGGAPGDKPFRTEVAPRIDPVFDDAASLREAIDQFFALQTEMESVRDEFSAAVHQALAQMGPIGAPPPTTCPADIPRLYGAASAVGRRYLALGRRFGARSRDIRRAEELGDTVALTPDYRARAKKAHDLYQDRVRDYREMRAAFYDQLAEEMRHAGCKLPAATAATAPDKRPDAGAAERTGPDPANPSNWVMDPPDEDAAAKGGATAAPAVWISIDNSRCAQPSALTIDGAVVGEIAAQKKIAVRTHAGPHELCVMPGNDKRTCGAPGTVRRAYLHDGWTLVVRCGN
jgi:hypothetical protein